MTRDIEWLRAACGTGVLVSWEVVVVLLGVLEVVERMQREGKS